MKRKANNALMVIGLVVLVLVVYSWYTSREHYVSNQPDLILHEFDPTTQILTFDVTRPEDCTNCKLTFTGTLSLEGIERDNNFNFDEVQVTDLTQKEVKMTFNSPITPPPRILKYLIKGDLRDYDTTNFVERTLPK